jgi:hypothetical protein
MLEGKTLEGAEVFDFTRTGPLTLDEANGLVGVLNRVTAKYSKRVNDLITRLEGCDIKAKDQTSKLESEITKHIEEWNAQVRKLRGVPKGLWLVDIDSGDGYYCWKYPESQISFWHEYKSGYSGRISLAERAKRAQLAQRVLDESCARTN